jgi:secreted trypsin-like serine protease
MSKGTVVLGLAVAMSAHALTVFGPNPTDFLAPPGTVTQGGVSLDGVVRLNIGCSGALLSGGRQILTAAHCVHNGSANLYAPNAVQVSFSTMSGTFDVGVSDFVVNPLWSGSVGGGFDLAVLNLNTTVTGVNGYTLYSGPSAVGQKVELSGFGYGGLGANGSNGIFGDRRYGYNSYETVGSFLQNFPVGTLVGDFDGSTAETDALGAIHPSLAHLGYGPAIAGTPGTGEVDLALGDSGGPSFLNGMLVGVHSFIFRIGALNTDVNGSTDSSFGELFADTSVAAHQAWLQATVAPEPGTYALMALGLAAMWTAQRRRSTTAKPSSR